ncbi:hypothetical protein J6590_057298, partial [Homalodisca vitripennis]
MAAASPESFMKSRFLQRTLAKREVLTVSNMTVKATKTTSRILSDISDTPITLLTSTSTVFSFFHR